MNIFISGEDARMQCARDEALSRGHALTTAQACDAALLPLPDSSAAAAFLTPHPGKNRLVLHGRLLPSQIKALLNRGWKLKNIQENDAYILENAQITAEGALYAAMSRVPFTLRGAKCAVIGYGRIGQALTRLLLTLGAQVHVAARREASRQLAAQAGAKAYSTEQLAEALDGVQILFNTVPSPILTSEHLLHLAPGALITELASPPYGVDLENARALGFDAILESSIPSRYSPQTAARLLIDSLEAGESHG